MTDFIDVAVPSTVAFQQVHGHPTRLLLTKEQYHELVQELSTAGRYGDPVHWETYNGVHGRALTAERELSDAQKEIHRLKDAVDDALTQSVRVSDELEGLRITTAEDKRALDRVGWITASRDYWEAEARRYQTLLFHDDVPETDDVTALRATIVRQANEITELKGESA